MLWFVSQILLSGRLNHPQVPTSVGAAGIQCLADVTGQRPYTHTLVQNNAKE